MYNLFSANTLLGKCIVNPENPDKRKSFSWLCAKGCIQCKLMRELKHVNLFNSF